MDAKYFEGSLLAHDKYANDSKSREEAIGFECNICLDPAQDAVVTICGHLYCWKCIYKWMHLESQDKMEQPSRRRRQPQCPVCKADVTERRLVPIYSARGDRTGPNLGILIPPRPSSSSSHPNCRQLRRPLSHPCIVAGGMNAEMIYERILGNSISHDPNSYGSETERIRRHLVETERSLSKLCLFLLCFVIYCLVLF